MEKHGIKRPNRVLYACVAALLRPYLYLRYGFKTDRSLARQIKGPFIVLAAHPSNLDFLFAASSFYPRRFNVVVSRHWYGKKWLARLLRLFQCIPREQFRPDPASLRAMMQVVRDGGALLMFPEGEVNGVGRYMSMPKNVARLCKRLGVPVYAASTSGSYLSRPKWSTGERKGRVEIRLQRVVDAAALRTVSEDELFSRIESALYYNDYAWQEAQMQPFFGSRLAEGLHNLLYRCPRCGVEFAMQSHANALWCSSCGNRVLMDSYGFLAAAGAEDLVYRHVADWVEYQRGCLHKTLQTPDFALEAEAQILLFTDPKSLRGIPAGAGKIRLDREHFHYIGTQNDEDVELHIPIAGVFKFPFACGKDFEVPRDGDRVAFRPKDPGAVEKFVLALPLIHEAEGRSGHS